MTEKSSPQPAHGHTPGPWAARAFPAYGYGITAADSPQARESFAVVHFADTSRGRTTERAKADARLIAAAPELLEALEELADLVDLMRSGNYTPDSFTTQPARAAIAKVTGAQA